MTMVRYFMFGVLLLLLLRSAFAEQASNRTEDATAASEEAKQIKQGGGGSNLYCSTASPYCCQYGCRRSDLAAEEPMQINQGGTGHNDQYCPFNYCCRRRCRRVDEVEPAEGIDNSGFDGAKVVEEEEEKVGATSNAEDALPRCFRPKKKKATTNE